MYIRILYFVVVMGMMFATAASACDEPATAGTGEVSEPSQVVVNVSSERGGRLGPD